MHVLLEDVLAQNHILQDFEVDYHTPSMGAKTLLLNARCIAGTRNSEPLILLACEDITEHKEVERQKDLFLGIASHELKTPVTSIKLYTQMLQKRFLKAADAASATVVAKMDAQLSHLTSLMTELLDATKLQAGVLSLQITSFDVNDLVQDIVEEMQHTTDRHQIQIEGDVHELLSADRERMSQVLMNLLSNAIKYSPEAETILVRLTANTGTITLSIQDFGIGITADQQAHLFERFFRVRDAAHETFPGLGLGLYISAGIVKQHGGRIWVESQEGAGTTFFVSLPLK